MQEEQLKRETEERGKIGRRKKGEEEEEEEEERNTGRERRVLLPLAIFSSPFYNNGRVVEHCRGTNNYNSPNVRRS